MTKNRGRLRIVPAPLNGRDVQYLGAKVPTAGLVDPVERWRSELSCLSLALASLIGASKSVVRGIERKQGNARPIVLIDGLPINCLQDLATLIGADAWSANAAEAVTVVGTRLVGSRPRA